MREFDLFPFAGNTFDVTVITGLQYLFNSQVFITPNCYLYVT